jgi:hypothetical protein
MQIDEQSPQYTSFLRSGAYPVISRKLVQYSDLLARAGGLAALAIIAGGAGYTLTQWLVPSRGAQVANAADSASAEAEPVSQRTYGTLDSEVLHANTARDTAPTEQAPEAPATLPNSLSSPVSARTNAIAGRSQEHDVLHAPSAARKPRHKISDSAEAMLPGAVQNPDTHVPAHSSSPSTDLDLLSTEGLRNELIAERVRALDDVREQTAPNPSGAANAAASAPAAERHALTESNPPAAQPTLSRATAFRAKAAPSASARVPVLQLRAAANIEDLSVRGSLSASNVRRSIERLRPALAACYEQAAQHAGRNRFGRVALSLTIDETGRARTPRVQGAELPGLGVCLNSVTSKLVSQAPDTGTVRASVVVNFAAP